MAGASVLIGTSGWSYLSGEGKWWGIFYPRGADELEFYARFFDTAEVNSTFYRPATPQMARSWVRRTPPGFRFSVKLWQKFTHPRMFEEATGERAIVEQKDFQLFKKGLDPLAEEGRLGSLLIQFPPSFRAMGASLEGLERHLVQFREYPLAVELRHRSWGEVKERLKEIFCSLNVSWVYIDEPKFSSSIEQTLEPTGDTLYVRFHGRNRAKWWQHQEAWERYDYFYSEQELLPFAEAFRKLLKEGHVRRICAYFNNHARAQAVANALMLKGQMGLPLEGDLPEAFLEAYPGVKALTEGSEPSGPRDRGRRGKGQISLF
ncbi:MAG: DUF72 domain-containing protein [Nitrospinota bacterium]